MTLTVNTGNANDIDIEDEAVDEHSNQISDTGSQSPELVQFGSIDGWDEGLLDEQSFLGHGDVDLSAEDLETPGWTDGFIQPRPKCKPLDATRTSSSSMSAQVDPLVGRSIDRLVQDRLSETSRSSTSFLDSMSFESTFSLDKIWKMPSLPEYGRFETLSARSTSRSMQETETVETPYSFKRKRLLAASFARTDDQLEMNAMRKLREIVLYRPQDSRLGRALMDIAGRLVSEETIRSSFSDCVAGKAPGTIAKRVADYHRFARWTVENGKGGPMQLTEPLLYEYALHMKASGASATSLQSFLKSIGFMEHHVGFAGCDVAFAISGRVTGVSKTLLATKRELHQAPPLTADDVYKLEKLVCQSDDKDACIGGFMLFTLFASARFADAARANSVSLETSGHIALLESSTLKFKTASTAGSEMRNVALPMLALGMGLFRDAYWGERWIHARKAEGLDKFSCLMPAWSEVSMKWLDRPMSSGEGVWFLREMMVAAGVGEDRAVQYSTHSLKTTCLSWAATSGAMNYDQRRIMGHHFDSRLAMPLLYSRDALAEIQTCLWRILRAIQTGQFDPDASRAQRIAQATMQLEGEDSPDEVVSDESLEPEDLELGEHLPVGAAEQRESPGPISMQDFETCLQHSISGVIHARLDADTLVCSRKISKNFARPKCRYEEVLNFPLCSQCATHLCP